MTALLYRQSALIFGTILLLVLWAFWPSYFSRLSQPDLYIHAHALSLTLWCLLLVVQAYAIRAKRHWIHRQVGIISPLLMLIVLIATLALMQQRMQGLTIMDWNLQALAFNMTTLTTFVLLYALAMYHRHDPDLHARYMICTALPLFTAFAPRLITSAPPLVDVSMRIFGRFAALSQAGLIPADAAAIALSVWDWRSRRRLNVFPIALGLLLTIHASVVTLYRIPLWKSAVEWFVNAH